MTKFIDLFCGIGGFRIALEKLGLECVFSSEIDKHASQAYKRYFGDDVHGNITQIDEKEIPSHDVLCAGFPCQSFSINGKRLAFDDLRGNLFYNIVRIAKYHKPSILMLENVRNILRVDNSNVIDTIIKELNDIGYEVHYSVLNSAHFGVPQNRIRVYFVCLKRDLGLTYQEPFPTMENVYLCDMLEPDVDEGLYPKRTDYTIDTKEQPYCLRPIRIGQYPVSGQLYRIRHPNGVASTLSATGGSLGRTTGLYYIDGRVRRLSITECKRIMCFPTDYDIDNTTQGFSQIGNAVIPKMIEIVYKGII